MQPSKDRALRVQYAPSIAGATTAITILVSILRSNADSRLRLGCRTRALARSGLARLGTPASLGQDPAQRSARIKLQSYVILINGMKLRHPYHDI